MDNETLENVPHQRVHASTETETDAEEYIIIKFDKIQQFTNKLDSLTLELKQLKDEFKSSPSMVDIQNLMQQNNSSVNLNIDLRKAILNYTARPEGISKNLSIKNSIANGDADDTHEANNGEETPKIKGSLLVVEQSPKITMSDKDDYAGPRLEDGRVTLKFMEELVKYYKEEGILNHEYSVKILLDVFFSFESQPSLIDIKIPEDGKFTIVGSIYGGFSSLLKIFEINGFPSETNPYLFNGNIGNSNWSENFSTLLTVFGYKSLYPNHVFIARVWMDSWIIDERYSLENLNYASSIDALFGRVFKWLPLAHCLNSKVLAISGGLFSRDDVTLDEIRRMDRHQGESKIKDRLLCSIPQSELGIRQYGKGIRFGPDVTKKFLKKNNLDYIVTSHQAGNSISINGFKVHHSGKCITLCSASNFWGSSIAQGQNAIMILNGKDMTYEIKSFNPVY